MIGPSGAVRVMLATRPVDFRKGMDGLAALVGTRSARTRSPVRSTCSARSGDTVRHSAYRLGMADIAYPWHPLHGRRLPIGQRHLRDGTDLLFVEERPGVLREVPAWMCDAVACSAMTLGLPMVTVTALIGTVGNFV